MFLKIPQVSKSHTRQVFFIFRISDSRVRSRLRAIKVLLSNPYLLVFVSGGVGSLLPYLASRSIPTAVEDTTFPYRQWLSLYWPCAEWRAGLGRSEYRLTFRIYRLRVNNGHDKHPKSVFRNLIFYLIAVSTFTRMATFRPSNRPWRIR
jgi:hypothetical protein